MSEIVFVLGCVIFVDHVHIVAHGTQEFVKKKTLRIEVCHQRKLVMLDRQLSLYFFLCAGLLKLSLSC